MVIGLSIMSFAMPDAALGTAWPFIREDMGLPLEAAGILPIIHSVFFVLICILNGRIAKYISMEKRNLLGLFMISASFFIFSSAPNFIVLVVIMAFVGCSSSLINNGITEFCAGNLTSRQYNWTACFFGLGASLSPVIITQMILISSWRQGYVIIAGFQGFVALLMLLSIKMGVWPSPKKAPSVTENESEKTAEFAESDESSEPAGGFISAKRYQILNMLIFFLYVGMEIATVLWVVSVLIESRGLDIAAAGLFPTVYFACLMTGRLLFGFFAKWAGNMTILRMAIALTVAGFTLLTFTNSIIGIAVCGLGHAPMFPVLMHETPRRFGKQVLSKLVGFQLAAGSAGAAIISYAVGLILTNISPEALFPFMISVSLIVFIINEIVARSLRRVRASQST